MIVNIDVPDLEAARRFYADGLGFEPLRLLFDGAVLEMAAETTRIYLIAKAAGTAPVEGLAVRRDYGPHWTPVHLDVVVGDIDAAHERALAAGAVPAGGIRSYEWGRLATLRDPFGHGVCLLQFDGRGYDAVA